MSCFGWVAFKPVYSVYLWFLNKKRSYSVSVIFDNIALYFECQINKKYTPSDCFFGDFSHWEK